MEDSNKLKKQHLKTIVFRSYIFYLRKHFPELDIDSVCQEAGLDQKYLLNDDNWVSLHFEDRLMSILRERILDPDLIRKVGSFGVQKEVVGSAIHFLATKILNLDTLYENLPFVTSLFNKVMRVEIQAKEPGRILLRLSPILDGLSDSEVKILMRRMPDYIQNTVGYYSSIPTQKKLPLADVSVEEIVVDGVPVYYLEVRYAKEHHLSEKVKDFALVAISGVLAMAYYVVSESYYESFKTFIISFILFYMAKITLKLRTANMIVSQTQDTLGRLDRQYKSLYEARISLVRKLEESNALNQLVSSITSSESESDIVEQANASIIENLGYDRSLVLFFDVSTKRLKHCASIGFDGDLEKLLRTFEVETDIPSDDPKKIANVFKNGNSLLVKDVFTHIKNLNDHQSIAFLQRSKSKSFVAVPIKTGKKTYGIMFADSYKSERSMTEDDCTLLTTVGKQLAIAIERERARQEVKDSLAHAQRLSQSYSRFVPWESLNHLNYKSIFDVRLGDGLEKCMTILFSDIRDFSKLCETMGPREILTFLNEYYGRLSPIINSHGGTIDKFIGDCIMAVFSEPQNAIFAAIEIQREIFSCNVERLLKNQQEISAGVGICQGPVIIGPLGFNEKMEVTVLSDTVNIASRLDGLNKKLNSNILVAGFDARLLRMPPGVFSVMHGDTVIRGKDQPVGVIEIVDGSMTETLMRPMWKNEQVIQFFDRTNEHIRIKKSAA